MGGYVRGLLFFLVPLFLSLELSSPTLISKQSSTMATLSRTLHSDLWDTSNPDPCRWKGVNCTKFSPSQVIGLSLPAFGLSNSSSLRLICSLDSLQSLNLSGNYFASIPNEFITDCGELAGLKLLDFSFNKLSGNLPNFSGFKALDVLDLSHNLLEGPIDSRLWGLTKLRSLNMSFNRFNGTVPGQLGSTVALQELGLSHNQLSGTITPVISIYTNLTFLDLSANNLSGSLPKSTAANLPNLEVLILSSNNLTGQLPENLSSIKGLRWFAANSNQFTGAIPEGITNHLRTLDLSFNSLEASIPPDLLSPPNLQSLDLTSNSLKGSIPYNISRRLFRLRLGGNKLNGTIPPAIGELTNLQYLELEGNGLVGVIPPELGNLVNLRLLNLANNRLRGVLPKQMANLRKLVVMKLQRNQIEGSIPDELPGHGELLTLDLSQNLLSGTIPPSVSNLTKVTVLNLECNQLNGSIPMAIGNLGNLMELQLGNNHLSGDIPRMPQSLSTALNLSRNHLRGSIPITLGSLHQLEVLDLSYNNLTGQVPNIFYDMVSLNQLILSHNQLSGVLPPIRPWLIIDSAGNNVVNGTTSAGTFPTSRRRLSPAITITVSVVAALVGFSLAALIFIFVTSRRFYRVKDETPQTGEDRPLAQEVIEGSFLSEDSVHASQIDFAKAMEEVSNPSNVLRKGRFSTYYKAAMPRGASYCVKKLNWSDRIFQSAGNQGRFRQALETLGRLSNSNVMAPLAYVLTADSAYLFYEHVHKGALFDFLHEGTGETLDWPCRYSIALGVAQGLTFLHGCNLPVLLPDLSSKSILLKSLKEPQIADIELFKVIDPAKSTGSFSTLAGSVGYIPPEYAYTMRLTTAGNVYSFGVVLLELLTGKLPVNQGTQLAKWALTYSSRVGEWEQILDPSVCRASLAVRSQMLSVMKIALSCVSQSAEARPKMRNVLRMMFNAR